MRLLQRALCYSGSQSIRRNLGLLRSEYKYCASLIALPLSLDVLDLIPENCVRMHAILFFSYFLGNPVTNQEDLPADLSLLISVLDFWEWH